MKCPKCGYLRIKKDNDYIPQNECPSCGIIYDKHGKDEQSSGPILKPSPVSADSLLKARERVERRLQKQQKEQHRDPRHNQTLILARRLTAEGVRQRQADWEEQHQQPASDAKPQQPSTTIGMALKKRESEPTPSKETDPQIQAEKAQAATGNTPAVQKSETTEQTPPVEKEAGQPEPAKKSHIAAVHSSSVEIAEASDQAAGGATEKENGQPDDQVPDGDPAFASNEPIPLFQHSAQNHRSATEKPPTLKEMRKDLEPHESEQPQRAPFQGWSNRFAQFRLAQLLPVVAWMILATGVIGAILSWTTLANAQVGANPPALPGLGSLPLGLLLGFAYLATGVLGFAFFWVSSLISRQLKDIQRLLQINSAAQIEPKEAA